MYQYILSVEYKKKKIKLLRPLSLLKYNKSEWYDKIPIINYRFKTKNKTKFAGLSFLDFLKKNK